MSTRPPPSPIEVTRLPARGAGAVQLKCSCPGGGGSCPACSDERADSPLQTKLTVSQPGDRFEREADRVADQVMRMSDASVQELEPDEEIQRQAEAAARFGHDFARVGVNPPPRGTP